MARAADSGAPLVWLLVVFLARGVAGSETYSFWRVVAALPHTAGMKCSIEDPSLVCMTGRRTEFIFNPLAKTATYFAHYKGLNGTEEKFVTYDYSRANPDVANKATLVVGKDYSHPVTITVGYTDYRTCFVTILPFGDNEQCILLVEVEFVDEVPQSCNDAFTRVCGDGFTLYSKDLCQF